MARVLSTWPATVDISKRREIKHFDIKYGIPRLGLLQFVLYSSELFNIIQNHLPNTHTYVDDTQLYISFKPDGDVEQEAAVLAMQHCISGIKQWMLNDKLKLNDRPQATAG